MITDQIRVLLKKADSQIALAENELNRPHEDVVTLSACQSVRSSMKQMMRLYLLAHGVGSDDLNSNEDLMNACIKVNPSFSGVDISNIECKGMGHAQCEGKYCLSIENVSCCLAAAKQVKGIVWAEYQLN